ncbi:hypothetical protein NE237_015391 [Protea cynaroides]|uniref:Uncharacterized protein n=1 Tax=Protea cynaroides TaxID=273540 RepID=A0A9Q0KDZ4_9MAGN|nr:hypothetical protein NE237_015391 [Protea cynaroides]
MGAAVKLLLYFNLFLVQLQLWSSFLPISYSAEVRYLPGFPGPLPFHLETGYVGVGESEDVQLFYYFVKSAKNPEKDPLLLWLTGGPLYFVVKEYNGSLPNLVLNPHSWTQVASIIFVDSPVGTGFSYSISSQGHQTGDFKTSKQLYQFLTKWMFDHPEFLNNHFYVAGDSYSGKIVPLVAKEISDGNEAGNGLLINLKGYLLGNPITDLAFDRNKIVPFCHGMGLIPDELYESLKRSCGGNYIQIEPTNVQCLKDMQSFHKCISGLNPYQILEPLCVFVSPKPKEMVGDRRSLSQNYYKILDPQPPIPAVGCRNYGYLLAYYWTNDIRVQNALHIQKKWQRCKYDLPYLFQVQSSIPYHAFLSKKGYPSLIYSGDHDMAVPFLATEAWIKSLNYSIVDEWRSWIVDGQIGGYTRTYSNHMTYATVKPR